MYLVLADRGESEADFSRRIGERQQTVNNWKRRGAIAAGKVRMVARALGVSQDWLETGVPPKFVKETAWPQDTEQSTEESRESLIYAECFALLPDCHRAFLWRTLRFIATQVPHTDSNSIRLKQLIEQGEHAAKRQRRAA